MPTLTAGFETVFSVFKLLRQRWTSDKQKSVLNYKIKTSGDVRRDFSNALCPSHQTDSFKVFNPVNLSSCSFLCYYDNGRDRKKSFG